MPKALIFQLKVLSEQVNVDYLVALSSFRVYPGDSTLLDSLLHVFFSDDDKVWLMGQQ